MSIEILSNDIYDLVKCTIKDGTRFTTQISDDKTQIIQTFLFFNHEIEVHFNIVEMLERKNSCKGFISYLKTNIEKTFKEYWGKLNESKN